MNLQEFAALKVGDKINNFMTQSQGEVVEASDTGVRVCWSGVGLLNGVAAGAARHYGVNTTAWMHWSKVDNEADHSRVVTD